MPVPIQPTGAPKPQQVPQNKAFENPKFLEQFIINLNDSPTETTEQMIRFLIEVNKLKIASQQNRNIAKALKELQAKADKSPKTIRDSATIEKELEQANKDNTSLKTIEKLTSELAKSMEITKGKGLQEAFSPTKLFEKFGEIKNKLQKQPEIKATYDLSKQA